jgi:hypothetical protein
MAKRSLESKKRARLVRAMSTTPTGLIDLVDYIRLRTRCTAGRAKAAIMAGALTVDGEPIGFIEIDDKVQKDNKLKVFTQYVRADLRDRIVVVNPSDS